MQSAIFKRSSVFHLNEYLLRLKKATAALTDDQVWWKPHPNTISIGNILKHLNGNLSQWIISGFNNEEDHRNRASEFIDDEKLTKEDMLETLSQTVAKTCSIIERINENDLPMPLIIQGFSTTKMAAIYHVVEHFSWHTGQVTWITKMQQGENHQVAFYDNKKLNEAHN